MKNESHPRPSIPGARSWRRARVRYHAAHDAYRVSLASRDAAILRARHLGFTGPQIAAEFGITKERVYQIEKEAVTHGR